MRETHTSRFKTLRTIVRKVSFFCPPSFCHFSTLSWCRLLGMNDAGIPHVNLSKVGECISDFLRCRQDYRFFFEFTHMS